MYLEIVRHDLLRDGMREKVQERSAFVQQVPDLIGRFAQKNEPRKVKIGRFRSTCALTTQKRLESDESRTWFLPFSIGCVLRSAWPELHSASPCSATRCMIAACISADMASRITATPCSSRSRFACSRSWVGAGIGCAARNVAKPSPLCFSSPPATITSVAVVAAAGTAVTAPLLGTSLRALMGTKSSSPMYIGARAGRGGARNGVATARRRPHRGRPAGLLGLSNVSARHSHSATRPGPPVGRQGQWD